MSERLDPVNQPVTVEIDDRISLYIQSRSIAQFSAEIDRGSPDHPDAEICFLDLRVDEDYRRRGLATRLFGALALTALNQSISKITGSVDSQHTLKIVRELFPDESIDITDIDPMTGEVTHLPITLDQAILSLERSEQFEDNLEFREISVCINIDLSSMNKSQFENYLKG